MRPLAARMRGVSSSRNSCSGLDHDPTLLGLDGEHVLGAQEPVPAVERLEGERAWLVLVVEPDFLDPAEVALGRLDEEPVRVA